MPHCANEWLFKITSVCHQQGANHNHILHVANSNDTIKLSEPDILSYYLLFVIFLLAFGCWLICSQHKSISNGWILIKWFRGVG